MFLLLIFYGGMELLTLRTNGNSTITTYQIDSYFDSYYEFQLDKLPGLQIAFGLTAYDNNYEAIVAPEYVTVRAQYRSWSPEEDATKFQTIDTRPCTREELGLGEDEEEEKEGSRFYPVHPRSEYWMK